MTYATERVHNETPPVDRPSHIWRRLNEHKIVQWAVAYLALAYAIQHALTLTGEAFEWPKLVPRVSMLLFALGLPLVVTFAWYHGERASRRFSAGECTFISLLLLGASLLFSISVHSPLPRQGVTAAHAVAADPHTQVSIAVLPCSGDAGQEEYISDGIVGEIAGRLPTWPDLPVRERGFRPRVMQPKKNSRSPGQALPPTLQIRVCVPKAGNRVRVTAQLIKADDGTLIWASDYDNELSDVFAMQEEIARSMTTSLHMLGFRSAEPEVRGP